MVGYRLCQVKKAENPYFIENISTSIYTIEELCYYFNENLYLLDDTILNRTLTGWLKDELDLPKLARKMEKLLNEETSAVDLVLLVMKEIHYLNQAEQKILQQKIHQMEEQPDYMRQKLKGDYLVNYKKYGNALKVYDKVLRETKDKGMGVQFTGSVYHNMGCAYARLFQMEEARECFEKANQLLRTKRSLKSYLSAVYLSQTIQTFQKRAQELAVEEDLIQELESSLAAEMAEDVLEMPEEAAVTDELLERMTREYHKNTGF